MDASEFRILRSDVAAKVGADAIDVFDKLSKRAGTPDLVYPVGWTETATLSWLRESARALWRLARAGLIPLTEKQALEIIVKSGKKIGPPVRRLAKVRVLSHAKGSIGELLLKSRS